MMQSFKGYLKETVQRKKVRDFVFDRQDWIPISTGMIERLFGIKRVTAFHLTDIKGIESLVGIQHTQKAISCFTEINLKILKGKIESGGGFVARVEGNVLVGNESDIFSDVDEQGRRWVRLTFFTGRNMKVIKEFRKQVQEKILNQVFKKHSPAKNDWYDLKDEESEFFQKVSKTEIGEAIRLYMDDCETFIANNKKEFEEKMFNWKSKKGSKKTDEPYNELLVNDFEIKKIYVIANSDSQFHREKKSSNNLFNWIKIRPRFKKAVGRINWQMLPGEWLMIKRMLWR